LNLSKLIPIETLILEAVDRRLLPSVNKILGEGSETVPLLVDDISVTAAVTGTERTEKERIVGLDAYFCTISFELAELSTCEEEGRDSRVFQYGAAFQMAVRADMSLGGIASRCIVAERK
jgi:hypothetical protein